MTDFLSQGVRSSSQSQTASGQEFGVDFNTVDTLVPVWTVYPEEASNCNGDGIGLVSIGKQSVLPSPQRPSY